MAKQVLLFLAFLCWGYPMNTALANVEPDSCSTSMLDECNMPPPDSFRVTQIGTHFISLAWHPVSPGADHYMEVYEDDGNGGWDLINVFPSVMGSTKTVDELTPNTKYKIKIYTKCSNGEPGILPSVVDPLTLILELTIGGRVPLQPQIVDCHNIRYLEPQNEWVGYRVSTVFKGTAIVEYFEFKGVEESGSIYPQIRRYNSESQIVAGDSGGDFPNSAHTILLNNEYVNMGTYTISDGFKHFGYIDPSVHGYPIMVDLCPAIGESWDSHFHLETLVATKATIPTPSNKIQNGNHTNIPFDFKVQSPIQDNIKIICNENQGLNENANIKVFNQLGKLVLVQSFDISQESITIPSNKISSGIYTILIEDSSQSICLKAIKL